MEKYVGIWLDHREARVVSLESSENGVSQILPNISYLIN
jgi:hypothetical protein